MDIYRTAIRPVLFSIADPERLHQETLQILHWIDQRGDRPPGHLLRQWLATTCCLTQPRLEQKLLGLTFKNPVGLAPGFDKDGLAAGLWSDLGFGFAELGTVTLHSQPGNPRPRLFRLPQDRAVLNRMGFNNRGAAALATQLQHVRQGRADLLPLGVNLGKSKVTPLEAAAADYLGSFRLLKAWGDYFVVNVSSPNTPGLRSLQERAHLEPILVALQEENTENKPIFVKIAPDLEWEAIATVLELIQHHRLAGIIATNTTVQRQELKTQIIRATGKSVREESGGISGLPLRQRSTEIIRWIWQQTQGTLPIIGVGGIFTAEDAWEKIIAGASLVQLYTGLVYEGPWAVRRILEGLLSKLNVYSLASLSEAVGLEHR